MRLGPTLALIAALLAASPNLYAAPEIAPDKRAEIDRLLEVTGALQLSKQFSSFTVTQLTNALRAQHADVPQKALDVLPEEVNAVIAENMDSFKEMVVRIYDEHLSLEDLKGLNQFYSTDLGRKVIKVLPSLAQESMLAGQKWGQALGPEIARRIQARFQKEKISL